MTTNLFITRPLSGYSNCAWLSGPTSSLLIAAEVTTFKIFRLNQEPNPLPLQLRADALRVTPQTHVQVQPMNVIVLVSTLCFNSHKIQELKKCLL